VNQANANLDKNLLSDKYEKVIANMKDSFAISKQNFMNILQERENEVLQNVNVHKNEKEQFHKQIVEQISKYDKLNKQYLNQLNENRTQSAEIENLKTELQRVKKELNIITKERNMFEEKCDVLFKDNNTLSNLNKELNRVTHGKFSTGSKSRISTMTSNKN
jgi:succinate dehydrogenase flavin-adding protein (antitoxin of CptAB toxin-antitoxin module)